MRKVSQLNFNFVTGRICRVHGQQVMNRRAQSSVILILCVDAGNK
jgi:hypothetical protein